jgi:5-(carboxyamino)imidazole ribonucleotide mutase
MAETKPLVGIVMGSQSDWPTMKNAADTLTKLGIANEAKVLSAHRTPEHLAKYVGSAKPRGIKVLIAGAGMAAALPGAIAALTPLPVLGVPMKGEVMGGLDAILSMVQMPAGIPVGTLAVGRSGAVNAALLAASILALADPKIEQALDKFRADQTAAVKQDPESET